MTVRVMRGVGRLLGVVGVVVSLVCVGVVGAVADDGVITDQPYVEFYGVKNAHAKGLDGSGVTIAMLDGWVDRSVPELEGADIESMEKCKVQASPDGTAHATTIASVLVSKAYGWVPKAKLLSYPLAYEDTRMDKCRWEPWDAIHDAVSKGVDVITIQVTSNEGAEPEESVAVRRAALLGVPVVWGAGNTGKEGSSSGMETNGAVAVGSHAVDEKPSEWATFGEGLTVTALGEGFTVRDPDDSGNLTRLRTGVNGTSFSAPMVAGALALGVQKWPDASGNQLIRVLIETAVPCSADGGWSKKCGYGVMDVGGFSKYADPTGLEDSNPLMEKHLVHRKSDGKNWQEYLDGVYPVDWLMYDTSYVYRGTDHYDGMGQHVMYGPLGSSPRYMKRVEEAEKAAGLLPKSQ